MKSSKKKLTTKVSLLKSWRNIKFATTSSWRVSKPLFALKLGLYTIQGLFPLMIAYLAGRLIDSIVAHLNGPGGSIRPILIILIASTVASYLYNQSMRLGRYIERIFTIKYELYITSRLHNKFAELDHSYYEDPRFHKSLNKISQNLGRINTFTDEIFYLLASVIQLLATGVTILKLNPIITLALIVGIIPLMRAQMYSSKERWQFWDRVDEEWRLRYNMHYHFLDTRAIGEIKIFQVSKYMQRLWAKYFKRNMQARFTMENKLEIRQLWAGLAELVTRLGIDIWLLLKVLAKTGFSLGDFEFYRRLVNDFSNASTRLVSGLQTVTETGLYMGDYVDLMELKPRVVESSKPRKLSRNSIPEIEFRDVSFKYPGSQRYVLKDVSFKIMPGEDVALVGINGAGKTTIIKLLMRFYDVSSGQILINGIDIKQLKLEDWYGHVGALFQDFNHYEYFKARRSIGVGNVKKMQNLSKIRHASKLAGADKLITSLPQGYESILSKWFSEGTELSGGEWQRIALARAFFRDAHVLILDEPTASIDAEGEYKIFKQIAKTQKNKTTIIISHRFSTVRNAHKIYVVSKGRITESGSHEDLIKLKGGTYKRMFDLQAAGYK